MNFKVEWLEGYGDVKPRICTMENFVSEEFNLEAYWGEDGMIEKLENSNFEGWAESNACQWHGRARCCHQVDS